MREHLRQVVDENVAVKLADAADFLLARSLEEHLPGLEPEALFVEETLLAITRGVEAAHKTASGVAPLLEPPGEDDDLTGLIFTREGGNLQPVFMLEFDVAVSAESKKASGVRGGIRVLVFISGDAKRSSETQKATVSRIKFKVRLRLTNHAAGSR